MKICDILPIKKTVHDKTNYKYCNQNLLEMYVFPAQSDSTWMSDDQQTITNLFGWTSVAVLVIICLWYIRLMFDRISEFFESSYEVCVDFIILDFNVTYLPLYVLHKIYSHVVMIWELASVM